MIFVLGGVIIYSLAHCLSENVTETSKISTGNIKEKGANNSISFRKYCEKYDFKTLPTSTRDLIKNGNLTTEEGLAALIKHIDPTDDFLKLKVEPGNPDIINNKEIRRTFRLPKGIINKQHSAYKFDLYTLKPRMLELMKQAIYEVRNKMIIMQLMRKKYGETGLYRMGYLISRADTKCKLYAKFAWLAYRMCTTRRQAAHYRMPLIDMVTAQERLINIRFEIELLVDLIVENDERARQVIKFEYNKRKEKFKFNP